MMNCSNDNEVYTWAFGNFELFEGCAFPKSDFQKDIRDLCKTYRLSALQVWRLDVSQNEFDLYPVWANCRLINRDFFYRLQYRKLLIKDLGVFGKAYATKQPWFSTDMSSIRNTGYPLSNLARMFGLRSAVSIPFLYTYNEREYSYAFDFFLPSDCTAIEEQMKTVNALISKDLPQLFKKYREKRFLSHCRFVLEPPNKIERSRSTGSDETTNISTSVNDAARSSTRACNLMNSPDGSSNHEYSDDDWVPEAAEFSERCGFRSPRFIQDIMDICKTKRLLMVKLWYLNRLPWSSDVNQNESCLYPVWKVTQVESFSYARFFRSTSFHNFCNGPLMEGQGLAGKAFATNQPWFSTDVSSIPNTDYPLSEDAGMLGLHSAVSIPFLLTYKRSMEYPLVFEFFLPSDCTDREEQMKIVKELISTDLPKLLKNYITRGFDLDYRCVLENLKEIKSGPNDSLSPNENPREASDGIRSSLEPGDQNGKNVELTEVGDTIGRGSCLSPAVNEISEQRHATGDKAINISTSVNDAATSTTRGKRTGVVRKQRYWAWELCADIIDNSNIVICKYCKLVIKGGGISRLKSHLSDSDQSKNVKKCKEVPSDIKADIEEKIEKEKQKKMKIKTDIEEKIEREKQKKMKIKREKQKKMTPKPTIIS